MSNSVTNRCNKRNWCKNQNPLSNVKQANQVSNLVVERKASLVVEIKDDTKRSSDEALGLGAFHIALRRLPRRLFSQWNASLKFLSVELA
jgi:hypothetical protein